MMKMSSKILMKFYSDYKI